MSLIKLLVTYSERHQSETVPIKDMEQQGLSFIAGGNAEWHPKLWKAVLRKLNIFLSYNPTVTLLGDYSNELKTMCRQKPTQGCLQQLYL